MPNENDRPPGKVTVPVPIRINPGSPHPAVRFLRQHTQGTPFSGQQFPLAEPGLPGAPRDMYPRPPHIEPPSGAFHFDEISAITLIGAGGSATLVVVDIPQGYEAVIRTFGQLADDFSIASWGFRLNAAPKRPFPDLRAQVGTLLVPTNVFVELMPADVFSVIVTNIGAIGVTVAARVAGWFWPV